MSWKDVKDDIIAVALAAAAIVLTFWMTAAITVLVRLAHAAAL